MKRHPTKSSFACCTYLKREEEGNITSGGGGQTRKISPKSTRRIQHLLWRHHSSHRAQGTSPTAGPKRINWKQKEHEIYIIYMHTYTLYYTSAPMGEPHNWPSPNDISKKYPICIDKWNTWKCREGCMVLTVVIVHRQDSKILSPPALITTQSSDEYNKQ